LLLSRERAKFSPARRKVKIAAGIAKAMSRTKFDLTTPPEEIAAVRSKNEFLEAPFIIYMSFQSHQLIHQGYALRPLYQLLRRGFSGFRKLQARLMRF